MNLFLIVIILILSIPTSLAFATAQGEINYILKKGNKFFQAEKYEEAIAIYDEVLELEPNHPVTLGKKGEAHAKLGNYDEALFYYDKILENTPNPADSKGMFYFEKALVIDPNHVLALTKKAELLFNKDRFDKAISYYDKVLEIEPNHADSLSKKGQALDILGNSQEAISYFDRALEIDPNQVLALAKKGDTYAKLGNYKEAMLYYDKVVTLSPRYSNYSGTPYYEKVLEIDQNHADSLFYKGRSFVFFDNLLEHAISYFDRVLEIEPYHTGALIEKGDALGRLGNSEEGMFYFDKALEIEPNNLDALSKKGDALVKLGNFDEGMVYFDKVLEKDPNHVDALYKKGDAFRSVHDIKKSFTYFYKVLENDPNHNLAKNKILIAFRVIGYEKNLGFMEMKVVNSEDNLVAHLRIPKIGLLRHEIADNLIEDWPITKIVTRNGTDYEVHEFERKRIVGYDGGVWGGSSHYGIRPPFGTNIWLVSANYWMFLPAKGDTITYTYRVFTPVE